MSGWGKKIYPNGPDYLLFLELNPDGAGALSSNFTINVPAELLAGLCKLRS